LVEIKLNNFKINNPENMKKMIFVSLVLLTVSFFTTCKKDEPATLPVLATIAPTEITATTAISGGIIISDGGAAITARGICWGIVVNPTISDTKTTDGDGKGQFVSNITGIAAATLYHVRAYATNSVGTAYGAVYSFSTLGHVPSATTFAATDITAASSKLNGTVNAHYASTTVTFEYGLTTDYGSIVTATPGSVTGNTSTDVSADISNLKAGNTYHFRVKAVNSLGTVYGIDMSYTTILADGYGNVYNAVTIGTQVWLKENLKTTKYNDGTSITLVTNDTEWSELTTPGYCWYNNDQSQFGITYGALYNWYTINTGKLCPAGWHVPTYGEWTILITYLGGGNVAGGKLKEAGTTHWSSPNTGAINDTGFTALPGGSRVIAGPFIDIGKTGSWWSSSVSESVGTIALGMYTVFDQNYFGDFGGANKQWGFSVRCLRDL
jgi:uncharacterized protein (TIGR02145 family)